MSDRLHKRMFSQELRILGEPHAKVNIDVLERTFELTSLRVPQSLLLHQLPSSLSLLLPLLPF